MAVQSRRNPPVSSEARPHSAAWRLIGEAAGSWPAGRGGWSSSPSWSKRNPKERGSILGSNGSGMTVLSLLTLVKEALDVR